MNAAIKILKAHIPSLSADDEAEVDDLRCDLDTDAADLAIRTCSCGLRIDGFYEYTDHLTTLFEEASR